MENISQSAVEYKNIDGFPDYRVGSDGSVWSTRKRQGVWRQLTPWKCKGYPWVTITSDACSVKLAVHQIVLRSFIGPCPDGMEACHENDIKDDNRLTNLRWGTHKANIDDLKRNGRFLLVPNSGNQATGERHGKAKLTESQVKEIRAIWRQGHMSQPEIGKMYGVSQMLISQIVTRRIWKHVA